MKPMIKIELFTDEQFVDWLIPATHHDFEIVKDEFATLLQWVWTHPLHWSVQPTRLFEGVRLSAKNLQALSDKFDIKFIQPTINQ